MSTHDDMVKHICAQPHEPEDPLGIRNAFDFICAKIDEMEETLTEHRTLIAELQDAVRSAAMHEHRLPTPNS